MVGEGQIDSAWALGAGKGKSGVDSRSVKEGEA